MTRLHFSWLLLLLPLACSGCLLTSAVWDQAVPNHVQAPKIDGVLMKSGTAKSLLVSYGVGDATTVYGIDLKYVYALIPLDKDGVAPYPFGVSDVAATAGHPQDYTAQSRAAGSAKLSFLSDARAAQLRHSRNYRAAGAADSVQSISNATFGEKDAVNISYIVPIKSDGAVFSQTHLLLLPAVQKRPALEHLKMEAIAVAVSPATVAFDLVMAPVLAIDFWIFGLYHVETPPRLATQPTTKSTTAPN